MAKGKSTVQNDSFIKNCAKVLMDQYNLDEDRVFEILKKCSPKENPTQEQMQIMDYDNLDASGDYSTQIQSIINYFSPNFVLALRSMEPAEAEELFFREDPSVLSKIELFFNQILPTIPLVSKDEIDNELSAFSDFIRDNHDKFILWGETDSIFKSCFWLQAGLTNCSLQFLKEPEDNKAYYRERAKKKIDPPNLKAPTRSISLPKELDSTFVSSLRINSSNRKKYHPFIGDKWFQDEEKELREKIVSFYMKSLQIISDFIANPDFSPSEKYLRLAERTFSVPELELLLGKSIRFFSWPLMLEIFTVLPPVVLLIGLLDAWLPRSAIESYLGRKSGPKGMVVATLLGSGAAGPLFSAFPIAAALLNKGSRVANVVIFLGSWATIKLPMILMESQFLGLKFSLLRTAITLPFIIWIGILMERFAPPVSRYFPADFVDFKPQ